MYTPIATCFCYFLVRNRYSSISNKVFEKSFHNTPWASELSKDVYLISGFITRMTGFPLKTFKRLPKRNRKAQEVVACEYSRFSLLLAARDGRKVLVRSKEKRLYSQAKEGGMHKKIRRKYDFFVTRDQVWYVMSHLDPKDLPLEETLELRRSDKRKEISLRRVQTGSIPGSEIIS